MYLFFFVCVWREGRENRKHKDKKEERNSRRFFFLGPRLFPSPQNQISGLLESVRSARYGKLRDGIGQLTGPMAVKLTNITASELNAVRPFFLGALTAFASVAAPPGGGNNDAAAAASAAAGAAAEAAPAAAATAPPAPASQSRPPPASQPQQQSQRFRTRNR